MTISAAKYGHAQFGPPCTDQSGDTAHIHDPRNTEIQITAFFCQDLTDSTEKDHCTEYDRRVN